MPILSRRRQPTEWFAALVATSMAWAPLPALAHGEELQAPGWRVDAALSLRAADANSRWPRESWPGVMLLGDVPKRQDGRVGLEHGVLAAQWRGQGAWSAEVGLDLHEDESPYLEQAAVTWQSQAWSGQDLRLVVGRQRLRWGPLVDGAGHLDPLGGLPLAKVTVINERWSEDGLSLVWRPELHPRLDLRVQAGLWAGRNFPAAPSGAWMPSLQVEGSWGSWRVEWFAAQARPEGRGTALRSAAGSGHRHGALDCRETLAQRVCFDGESRLGGMGLSWQRGAWTLSAAGLLRDERGWLYSTSGGADFHSRVQGAWLGAHWQALPGLQLGARVERLSPKVRLTGTGVALLAREAALADASPLERGSLSTAWQAWPSLSLGLELGSERLQGRSAIRFAALRLVWQQHLSGSSH